MRDFTGQLAFALQCGLLLGEQAVDRANHRIELAVRVPGRQARRLVCFELRYIARQCLQRLQAAQNGRAQGQRHHRQQPQAGLGQLHGDIFGQFGPLLDLHQHHHLPAARRIPLGKAAPCAGRGAKLQVGKSIAPGKSRQWRIARARQQMAARIAHQHAQRKLVIVLLQAGQ